MIPILASIILIQSVFIGCLIYWIGHLLSPPARQIRQQVKEKLNKIWIYN